MADTAFQTQYRQQFIASFEIRQSLLRTSVTTESVIKGNQAVFLVAGSGGASAVTRGVNGLIPARADDLTQQTATLQEWHDLVRKTGFNVFASQGDQVRIMQETTMAVVNRKIDADIIAQLDTATIDTGASVTASLALVTKALAALGYAEVPIDEENNLFGLITPGFRAYLMQTKEFASAQYVDVKPFVGPARKMLRWSGVTGSFTRTSRASAPRLRSATCSTARPSATRSTPAASLPRSASIRSRTTRGHGAPCTWGPSSCRTRASCR
jgi:hypothetical protein